MTDPITRTKERKDSMGDAIKRSKCPVCKDYFKIGYKESMEVVLKEDVEQHFYYHKLEKMSYDSIDVKLEALKLQGQHEKSKGY